MLKTQETATLVLTDTDPELTDLFEDNEYLLPSSFRLFSPEAGTVVNDGLRYGPVCLGCNIVSPLTLVCDQC